MLIVGKREDKERRSVVVRVDDASAIVVYGQGLDGGEGGGVLVRPDSIEGSPRFLRCTKDTHFRASNVVRVALDSPRFIRRLCPAVPGKLFVQLDALAEAWLISKAETEER